MKAIIKQLIIDFVGQTIPQPHPRDIQFPALPPEVKKGLVLIGMRRAGKTWTMYQEMHRLIKSGITKQQLIYLNFEDDRLIQFTADHWNEILTAYLEAFPSQLSQTIYLFLDEIQAAPAWEKFVLRLLEHENVIVYLSGSSAKMLSKEIATSLRGRTLVREVFPMSFKEVLLAKSFDLTKTMTTHVRATLQAELENYLIAGGFPETIHANAALRIELIQNYIDSVVYRDIIERYEISNITAVRQFIIHTLKNCASLLSINKIYNTFKSQGISVSKNALYDYAHYFEDAFCLFFVPEFKLSNREQNTKPMKVYPVDPGVIMAYSIKPSFELASTFETTVFLHLRRQYSRIFYYQTPSGKEIDFIVQTPQGAIALYQAAVHIDDPHTLAREISALEEAMQVLDIHESFLITRDKTAIINVSSGVVHCQTLLDTLIH